MKSNFKELLEEYFNESKHYNEGDLIKTEVLKVTPKNVVVDLGFKSEVYIDIEEFKNQNKELTINQGDIIEVFIELIDDGLGNTVASYQKALQLSSKEIVKKSKEENSSIKVYGKKLVSKGLVADFNSLEVFIPFSLLSKNNEKDYNYLINEEFEVKVIKYDFEKNSIFASRKHHLEEEMGINFEEEFANLNIGDIVKGKVKTFVKYGAFIDLGFMDSLLHLNDISWKKVDFPSDLLNVGQELEFVITVIDRDKKQVSVSLKDLDSSPWENFLDEVNEGEVIEVVINKIKHNGLIVSYKNNIDFFIHYTDLSWYSIKNKIEEYYSLNEKIEVKVSKIEHEYKNVKLNLKEIQRNPIIEFANNNEVGDLFEVKVIDSGYKFIKVQVQKGVIGYIFSEEVSWNFDSKLIMQDIKKGQTLNVKLKSIDFENCSLKFSLKEAQKNPFIEYINLPKGTLINCKVIESKNHFLMVETDNGAKTLVNNEGRQHNKDETIKLYLKGANKNGLELTF